MTTDYATVRAASRAAGYEQVFVGGRNVTYVRGAETVIGDMTLTEPFAYGPTSLSFPAIDANHEAHLFGVPGELDWVREDATVVIQRVDDPTLPTPTVLSTDYRGFVVSINADGRDLSLEVGGEFSARAASTFKPDILVRRVKDLGFWFANICQTLHLGLDDRDGPTTGIEIPDSDAGGYFDQWALDICAWSQTSASGQRTIMPKEWGGNVWGFDLKDTTNKDLTLYTADARVVANLKRDKTQIPTTWYGTGIDPDGTRWRNARYPGVFAGPAPTFPGNMGVGDTDATTTTGDGVTVLQEKLLAMGYLSTDTGFVYGTYATSTANAVKELQDVADLSKTGSVNLATWNALFDVDVTGYSLSGAHIAPLVQDPRVRQFNYTSNGSISGRNPLYDASVRPVERFVNFGDGVTKAQAVAWCRAESARLAGKNWTGTITLEGGFGGWVGEWGPADQATLNADPATGYAGRPDLIMSQLDIRPGMNAWLPMFDGGTLVHISGASINRQSRTVTLTVDTLARDFLDVAAINARNKEASRHLRREWFESNRAAKRSGGLVAHDELFGRLDRDIRLVGNRWNVFPVIAGQQGQVNQIRMRIVNDVAEFSVGVLSKPMTPDGKPGVSKRLMNKVGNPLVDSAESVWEKESLQDWHDDKVILYYAGDGRQPCGYSPRRHRNDDGDVTDAPITGRFDDRAPWPYVCAAGTHVLVYVAVYPDRDCTLKRGQILWAQEDDVA